MMHLHDMTLKIELDGKGAITDGASKADSLGYDSHDDENVLPLWEIRSHFGSLGIPGTAGAALGNMALSEPIEFVVPASQIIPESAHGAFSGSHGTFTVEVKALDGKGKVEKMHTFTITGRIIETTIEFVRNYTGNNAVAKQTLKVMPLTYKLENKATKSEEINMMKRA